MNPLRLYFLLTDSLRFHQELLQLPLKSGEVEEKEGPAPPMDQEPEVAVVPTREASCLLRLVNPFRWLLVPAVLTQTLAEIPGSALKLP